MKIFTHNDHDGALCRYWIERARDEGKIPDDTFFCKNYVMSYGRKFPIDDIKHGEIVVIGDFSIEPEEMATLQEKTDKVYWFDHHVTSIDKYKDYEQTFKKDLPAGYRVDGISGSALVAFWYFWDEFVGTKRVDGLEMKACLSKLPLFAQYVNDFDIWAHTMPESMLFILGSECHDFMNPDFWKECASGKTFVEDCVDAGRIVQKHKTRCDALAVGRSAYEVQVDQPELQGKKILALNGGKGSMTFGDNLDKYDFCMSYIMVGNKINASFYSKTCDCAKACESFGGGGHRGAAGFQMEPVKFLETFKFTRKIPKE